MSRAIPSGPRGVKRGSAHSLQIPAELGHEITVGDRKHGIPVTLGKQAGEGAARVDGPKATVRVARAAEELAELRRRVAVHQPVHGQEGLTVRRGPADLVGGEDPAIRRLQIAQGRESLAGRRRADPAPHLVPRLRVGSMPQAIGDSIRHPGGVAFVDPCQARLPATGEPDLRSVGQLVRIQTGPLGDRHAGEHIRSHEDTVSQRDAGGAPKVRCVLAHPGVGENLVERRRVERLQRHFLDRQREVVGEDPQNGVEERGVLGIGGNAEGVGARPGGGRLLGLLGDAVRSAHQAQRQQRTDDEARAQCQPRRLRGRGSTWRGRPCPRPARACARTRGAGRTARWRRCRAGSSDRDGGRDRTTGSPAAPARRGRAASA